MTGLRYIYFPLNLLCRRLGKSQVHCWKPLLEVKGTLVTDPYEISETLAGQFSSVSQTTNYRNEFLLLLTKVISERQINFSTHQFLPYNKPFSFEELSHALHDAKKSARGIDEITYGMLKHLLLEVFTVLLHLYNRIWENSHYPTSW